MRFRTLIFAGLLLVSLFGCALASNSSDSASVVSKKLLLRAKEDVSVEAEVADSPEERQKGLMYRKELDDGRGMWFIFEDDEPRSFWMKNTLIPLDIIFFDSGLKIVSLVESMQPCKEADCPSYFSFQPARYALEVPAGFIKRYGVKVGDKMRE
ncbi:DUF192 domain-containing protein [Candidatus Peregrinibacteria bacterium]|nr:DUF192 domain-containing protein [Candidatus Peregrinibacteria bacterium]